MKFKRLYEDEKMDIFPSMEEQRKENIHSKFDQELRAFSKRNFKPVLKKERDYEKKKISLELISVNLNDPIGPALDAVHEDIYKITRNIKSEREMEKMVDQGVFDVYLSKIEKLIYDRFGISICITQSMEEPFACCMPYIINKYNALSTKEERFAPDISVKDRARKFARANYLSDGEIDLQKVKISGALSKYNHIVNLEFFSMFVEVKATPREATACLLHEIGHLFTFIDMGYRTDVTNQILQDISNSIKVGEPASKRKYLLVDLAKNGSIDEKLVSDLAKEERPMILSTKLYQSIYKQYTNSSISFYYTDTISETLADDFATKFGYGREIITFLERIENISDRHYAEAKSFMLSLIPISIATFCLIPPLGLLSCIINVTMIASAWFRQLVKRLMMHIFNNVNMTYDELFQRMVRIKRGLVSILKKRNIPAHTRESTLAIIDSLYDILDKRGFMEAEDKESDLSYQTALLFTSKRDAQAEINTERLLEQLTNNNLYIASAKFESIINQRFGSNNSKSKLTTLENYDGVNDYVGDMYARLMRSAKKSLTKDLKYDTKYIINKFTFSEITMIADSVKIEGKQSVISVKDLVNVMTGPRFKTLKDCCTKALINKLPKYYNKFLDEELKVAHISSRDNPSKETYLKTNAILKEYFIDIFGFKEFYRNMGTMNAYLGAVGFSEIFDIPAAIKIEGKFEREDIERLYKCANEIQSYLPYFYKEDSVTYYLTKLEKDALKNFKAKANHYKLTNPFKLSSDELKAGYNSFYNYEFTNVYTFYENLDIYIMSYMEALNRIFIIINTSK